MSASNHNPAGAWRPLVERALATGEWEKIGTDGQNHAVLRHIPTGKTTAYATGGDSCSDRNGVRNFANDVKKISGHNIWERSSRKPSRKKIEVSGYRPQQSDNEVKMCAEINRLCAELREVDKQIARAPRETRQDAINFKGLLAWRIRVAGRLEQLHQPVPELKV